MKLKMGDLVMKKNETHEMLFQVTGFDGEYVVLKGLRIPIITISTLDNLIKLNRRREKYLSGLRLIK